MGSHLVLSLPKAVLFSLLIFSLVSVPLAVTTKDCYTRAYVINGKRLSAWRGSNYSNSRDGGWGACRIWDAAATFLKVNFDHFGGYDAGIGVSGTPRQIRELYTDGAWRARYMKATYTVTSVSSNRQRYWGHFYMGPKAVIISTSRYTTLDYNYECYIIEYSSRSVAGFKTWLKSVGGWKVANSYHNGKNYSHFRRNHGKIRQIFAVRDTWRPKGGRTDVNRIVTSWLDHGVIEKRHSGYYLSGWKHNLETGNRLKGSITFSKMTFA